MRYERKYKMYDLHPDVVRQIIITHPESFRKIYPDRQINNIYFDTPQLVCFNQNVNGVSHRKKFRVRWYGEDIHHITKPRLETKIRMNEVGTKKVESVDVFDFMNLDQLMVNVNNAIDTRIKLKPVLINSYKRSYFGTSDGQFRITVDYELRYFSLLTAKRFLRYSIHDPNAVVVEIKYEANQDIDTDRVTQHLPFRQTKSSKYVTGLYLST